MSKEMELKVLIMESMLVLTPRFQARSSRNTQERKGDVGGLEGPRG
jgi:hypothetical protein